LLKREWFDTLAGMKALIEAWQQFCEERRECNALGDRPPAALRRAGSDTANINPGPTACVAASCVLRSLGVNCMNSLCSWEVSGEIQLPAAIASLVQA
jgi:hypothetical protein